MLGTFLFLTYFFQGTLHYSAIKTGFAFLPFSGGIIIGAGLASRLLPRVGPRALMVAGMALAAGGLLWFTGLTVHSSYLPHVLPPEILVSLGMGMAFVPLSSTALVGVEANDAGVASALVNTTQQVLVQRGLTYSQPVSVNVAPVQPAVFANGLVDYPADQSAPYQVTETTPAKAGDTLVMSCAGLGLTTPGVADGVAAPSNPPAQTQNGVQVTIGGVSAREVADLAGIGVAVRSACAGRHRTGNRDAGCCRRRQVAARGNLPAGGLPAPPDTAGVPRRRP